MVGRQEKLRKVWVEKLEIEIGESLGGREKKTERKLMSLTRKQK